MQSCGRFIFYYYDALLSQPIIKCESVDLPYIRPWWVFMERQKCHQYITKMTIHSCEVLVLYSVI